MIYEYIISKSWNRISNMVAMADQLGNFAT